MVKNQFKTAILLATLTAILLAAGRLLAGSSGLAIAAIIAVAMNFFSYWFSDKIVLAMYRAKQAKESEYQELYKVVKEVTSLANMPMPKIYIINSEAPNAFATGRNPKNAAVACTRGILRLLSKDELKGVIAHEVSHIKNRDILVATIAATIAGIISYLAFFARFAAIFGGRDREGGGNIFSLLILAILTPIIAMIIQLAISRSREYLADETGARIIKNPIALANALAKLEHGAKTNPMGIGNEATASLFIVNPFRGRAFINLFSTHPPMDARIKRLKDMEF